jgi:ATP-dependent Clp protease ATP-binding subunit ClpA
MRPAQSASILPRPMTDTAQELVARLSDRSRSVLDAAKEEQRNSKQDEVTAEHLLLGILRVGGKAADVLEANGVTEDEARSFVAEALWDEEPDYAQLRLSNEVTQILEAATKQAGEAPVEPEHLLYGITAAGFDTTSRLLYALGADRAKLKADITAELGSDA